MLERWVGNEFLRYTYVYAVAAMIRSIDYALLMT